MSFKIIEEINKFSSFRFDENNYQVVNTRTKDMADIDELLAITYILDMHRISYIMSHNFSLNVLGKR
jgi:hypothetical protein